MELRSPYKSRGGLARLRRALRHSLHGLRAAWRHEAAFRQELTLFLLLLPCAFWLGGDTFEVVFLLASLILVLVVELLNSAIESLADAVTLEEHPLIARAKDLGSAAVLLTLILVALVWFALLCARLVDAL